MTQISKLLYSTCYLYLILLATDVGSESSDPMENFEWVPGRTGEIISPKPLMKYCRTSDKWFCAEYISNRRVDITYSCRMDQSVAQKLNAAQTGLGSVELIEWTGNPDTKPKVVTNCTNNPWSPCKVTWSGTREVDRQSLIYQLRGLDIGGNVQCMDFLNLHIRYERVVHNLSWVETDLWYEYKDEVLYLGPAAEAESFPSPESYTVTTDSGRVVHRMTTDNQVHLDMYITRADVKGAKKLWLIATAPGSNNISRQINITDMFPSEMVKEKVEDKNLPWKIIVYVLSPLLVIYIINLVLWKKGKHPLFSWCESKVNSRLSRSSDDSSCTKDGSLQTKSGLPININVINGDSSFAPANGHNATTRPTTTASQPTSYPHEGHGDTGVFAPPMSPTSEYEPTSYFNSHDDQEIGTDGAEAPEMELAKPEVHYPSDSDSDPEIQDVSAGDGLLPSESGSIRSGSQHSHISDSNNYT